jgi:hypothetical protein
MIEPTGEDMLRDLKLWPDVNPRPLKPEPVTPFLNTYTNRRVNPLALKRSDVSVVDIAHGLALCNRFAGHTSEPISVAQHSVWVSYLVEGTGYEMQALFHDASEAYLGDVTKWLKGSPAMSAYRAAEERITTTILSVLGQPTELADCVKEADKLMVCWEAEQGILGFFDYAMPPGYGPLSEGATRTMLTLGWEFITWQEAEDQFRRRCNELAARKCEKGGLRP